MEETYNIPVPLQNIGCQDILGETESCTHSGWLRKKRTVKLLTWRQVYVVLHEGCLYYFNNERAKRPSGKFSLYGYNSVFRASEVSPKEATWVFKIVHSHSEFRTYYLSASSEQEMKTWMLKIKQEMLKANGKILMYGKRPHKEERPEDDNKFYQDVEQNIYDDAAKFKVTQEYSKKCSVKRENEDSDEDEDTSIDLEKLDSRPPLPLPNQSPESTGSGTDQRAPLPPPRPSEGPAAPKPPFKPPRMQELPDSSPKEPRVHRTLKEQDSRSRSPSPIIRHDVKLMEQLTTRLKVQHGETKHTAHKRRPSYEETDVPGSKSPSLQRKHQPAYQPHPTTSAGGSTGSDGSDDVPGVEYWTAIHYTGDKHTANDIIQGIGEEGVYLVRQEAGGTGKVLVVFAGDTTKKYRIQQEAGEYFLAREGYRHDQLQELLRFYYEEELPTVQVKLKGPYKLHPKFKELNLD